MKTDGCDVATNLLVNIIMYQLIGNSLNHVRMYYDCAQRTSGPFIIINNSLQGPLRVLRTSLEQYLHVFLT